MNNVANVSLIAGQSLTLVAENKKYVIACLDEGGELLLTMGRPSYMKVQAEDGEEISGTMGIRIMKDTEEE